MEGEQPDSDSEPERAENDPESNRSEDDSDQGDRARESSGGEEYDPDPIPAKKKGKKKKATPKAAPKKRKKKKNKVKRPVSAYMWFSKETRPQVAMNKELSFAEIAREVSRQWSELSDEEKKPYQELNAQDKIRYEKDVANAPPPEDDSDEEDQPKKKKKKKNRDPNQPKRPKTAFFFYLDKMRTQIAEQYPEMKMSERSKLLGQMWQKLPQEEKQEHIDKNTAAKEEYKVVMAKYLKDKEGGD